MSQFVKAWRQDNEDEDVIYVQFDDGEFPYNLRHPIDQHLLNCRLDKCEGCRNTQMKTYIYILNEGVKHWNASQRRI